MTWAMLVPRKGTVDQLLAQQSHTLRRDNEPAIEALAREIAQARQEGSQDRSGETIGGEKGSPVGSSNVLGDSTRGWSGQNTAGCAGASQWDQSSARRKVSVPAGEVRCDEQVRRGQRRKDTVSQTAWTTGQHTDPARQATKRRKVGTAIPSWSVCWHAVLVVRGSGRLRARAGDQHTRSKLQEISQVRWDADGILGTRAVPWSPDGCDDAFDTQVGMERPAKMVPGSPREVLMQNTAGRTHLRRADFEQWGLSEGCPGSRYLRTGQGQQSSQRSMSEEDRSLVERRLVWTSPIGRG